jgi:hypothetical protein
MRAHALVPFVLAALALPLAVSVACTSPADPRPDANPADPCINGLYVLDPEFSDEACHAYVDAESSTVVDKTLAPIFTAPAAGAKLPATPPARFAWTAGTIAVRASPWRDLVRELGPLREAHAHGSTTGVGYVLTFKDGGGKEVLRVMTLLTEHTPSDASWAKLKAAGALTVSVVGVRFTNNAIAAGSKPTVGAPLACTISS